MRRRPRHLAIVERRAPWRDDLGPDWTTFPIAAALHQGQQDVDAYWRDRHLRFHRYDLIPPSPRGDDLLEELDRDPTHIFWA